MMSNATSNDKVVVQSPAAEPEKSGSTLQAVLIGIIVLAAAALLAYQFLGCSSCYAPV
jgi:hypothetical protein